MHIFSNTFNTFILSTLRIMLASKKRSNRRMQTMNLLFKSLFQYFTACFPRLFFVRIATYFQDATCPNLKLTSIHTFSKSLSYLHICVLREPKGSRTILIYFEITTYYVGQLGRLPPYQNIATSYLDTFLPSIQFMTN